MRLPGPRALFLGHPRFHDSELADVAERHGVEAAWRAGYQRFGPSVASRVGGDFAAAFRDDRGNALLVVDRFARCTLCYRLRAGQLEFAERADELAGPASDFDAQSMYNYLYFHVIPAPNTIFRDVLRLPAGHVGHLQAGKLTVAPWWTPIFVESERVPFAELKSRFRRILAESIGREIGTEVVGCFLSGGTDSSTVAGLLGEATGKPAQTFSIGFDAEGYDEMEYARIAARHFGTDHHEYYVTPDDLVSAIPAVAASYDQPFGNSSVVPAYYCAKFARESGVAKILGGDGGDELFGGNSRYAKQRMFDIYRHVPAAARRRLLEPMLGAGPLTRLPGVRKASSYVEQAKVPMPDRLQMYNLLTRLGLSEVLTPDFLASVDPETPARQQRDVYSASADHALINRMLAFDWRYTLADNDLPKVIGATSLAGIAVGFPLLDDALVDFSLRLEPELKLKGFRLRWFFKEALRGFLPDEILTKKKHGFGLPFGVWVNRHEGLKTLATGSLHSLAQRGIVRREFLRRLVDEHLPGHPGYYGEMVWVLMMLEQWLARPQAASLGRRGAEA
ncbi:MAG: asparagine synthase C-terminal domain-containing protein [Betaproteobacteria bacterium]